MCQHCQMLTPAIQDIIRWSLTSSEVTEAHQCVKPGVRWYKLSLYSCMSPVLVYIISCTHVCKCVCVCVCVCVVRKSANRLALLKKQRLRTNLKVHILCTDQHMAGAKLRQATVQDIWWCVAIYRTDLCRMLARLLVLTLVSFDLTGDL